MNKKLLLLINIAIIANLNIMATYGGKTTERQ